MKVIIVLLCLVSAQTHCHDPVLAHEENPFAVLTLPSLTHGLQVGLVNNSILFGGFFKIKDRCKKVRFQQTHNQGLFVSVVLVGVLVSL